MRNRRVLTVATFIGAAALLTGCAGNATPETSPAASSAPTNAAPSVAASTPSDDTGTQGAAIPGTMVSIEYEIDDTPGDDQDDDDKTTTDAGHIADLTALLERHDITSDYESDHDDCDDEWEIEVDPRFDDGRTIEIEIETCNPTPFEQELIDLVQTWP